MAFTAPRTWTDGELVTKAIMDPHIRDNFLAMGPHLMVRKTSDETVSASTTLQNDDVLLFNVPANEIWQFQFVLVYLGTAAGGLKIAFTFPGGTFTASGPQFNAAGTTLQMGTFGATTSPTASADYRVNSLTLPDTLVITGVYVNAGAGGNVVMQWAQQTASGSTTIKANSTLWAVKLA
jgi:hypothetical protein